MADILLINNMSTAKCDCCKSERVFADGLQAGPHHWFCASCTEVYFVLREATPPMTAPELVESTKELIRKVRRRLADPSGV